MRSNKDPTQPKTNKLKNIYIHSGLETGLERMTLDVGVSEREEARVAPRCNSQGGLTVITKNPKISGA